MKKSFMLFWALILSLSVMAQENTQSSAIFYQKMATGKIDVPQGAVCDHDHAHPQRKFKKSNAKFRKTRAAARWNSNSFTRSSSSLIDTDKAPELQTLSRRSKSRYCAVPMVDRSLTSFYASAKAHMPLYIPYRHSKVKVWQGFYYSFDKKNNTTGASGADGKPDFHGAIDYGRTGIPKGKDPTFGVYSIADGVVENITYGGGGNTIYVKHTAPNGKKYRSIYLHVRNGFSHDLNKAKTHPKSNAKYRKFAKKRNPSKLCWGTESQKIRVRKGQRVKAGQFLAWAGNTGSGGIGIILDNNGNIKNPNTTSFNVHLHFTLQMEDTRPGHKGEWIKVDPYGVYNKASNTCYNLDSETAYARLFAPFYPSFHNVPLEYINKYWGYYTGMGMSLQTISIDRVSNKLKASGSFQWGLSKSWYARFYMTASTYQNYFNQYGQKGFRPRQMSVDIDGSGKPRFTVIWEKKPAGQSSHAFHNRTGANFSQLWNKYVKTKKWHLQEHVSYTLNGKKYHAGIFVNKKNNNGFYMYHGMTGAAFNKKFKDLYPKWQLTSMHVNGNKVGGVWRPKSKKYAAYYGLTSSAYQKKFNELSKKGMRLYKIQSYNSGRFAAIWTK